MATATAGNAWRAGWLLLAALLPCACRSVAERPASPASCAAATSCNATDSGEARRGLDRAQTWSRRAAAMEDADNATDAWTRCALDAYPALAERDTVVEAATLATHCTDALLARVLAQRNGGWVAGPQTIDGREFDVEFRQLSPYLDGPLRLTRASEVSMTMLGGERMHRPGFGVPLAILSRRCSDRDLCELLPPEGVFRNATAWLEPGNREGRPRLVIADAVALDTLAIGAQRITLAYDTSAGFASGALTSKLDRLAIWGLLGGDEVGRRAGLYLLEDYDPGKRPLVMIHGLGSSPLTWARLTNAVWGAPDLRERFQVWHVVYQTNAPLLVIRGRVQRYLDEAWRILDPEGDDAARTGMVLVGHSMGGVAARMLCVDSGEVLWNAAFVQPKTALKGDPEDIAGVDEIFHFTPYPGVSRAIFISSPHGGSPSATRWYGRLARVLIGRRTPELQSLKHIADSNPQAVQPELRMFYQQARLNSITTLQTQQPVRAAGQVLMPASGIAYHTIAGALPGRDPPTDGVVPLASAVIPGAESTLVLPLGHDLHERPEGVAEVLRILRESAASDRTCGPKQQGRRVSPPALHIPNLGGLLRRRTARREAREHLVDTGLHQRVGLLDRTGNGGRRGTAPDRLLGLGVEHVDHQRAHVIGAYRCRGAAHAHATPAPAAPRRAVVERVDALLLRGGDIGHQGDVGRGLRHLAPAARLQLRVHGGHDALLDQRRVGFGLLQPRIALVAAELRGRIVIGGHRRRGCAAAQHRRQQNAQRKVFHGLLPCEANVGSPLCGDEPQPSWPAPAAVLTWNGN